MVNLVDRFKAAMNVFRNGYDYGTRSSPNQTKALPFMWPDFRQERPEWHMVDVESYIKEGYTENSLIYSAVMYKVRSTTTAPLRAYTGTRLDPVLLPEEHPLSLRVSNPNEYQSWTEFHARNMVFLNIAGDVFIYISPEDGNMYSLRPDRVFIVPNSSKPAGLMGYLYVPEGKSRRDGVPILPGDMLHIKLPNPLDPLEGSGYGLPPLAPAARSGDVDNMVTKFLNLFFKRGAMMTGILKFDIPLREETVDLILERWEKKYGGYENWKTGVLDRGGSYERVALTFEEMGFGEVDQRSETRILGPFGVPPILVGARVGLERSTYSNYEAARQAVWEDTLVPESRWFEVEYQRKLNTADTFVMFDYSEVPALQQSLPKSVSAAYTLVQMGVPPNQAIRAVGLQQRVGNIEGGDEPLILQGRGDQQGPRSDEEEDSWGMR